MRVYAVFLRSYFVVWPPAVMKEVSQRGQGLVETFAEEKKDQAKKNFDNSFVKASDN